MIVTELNFLSHSLGRQASVKVLIPQKKAEDISPQRTLYLLPGLTDDRNAFLYGTSIVHQAEKAGLAVVIPDGERSWYTDTWYGSRYFEYVAKELPALFRSTFRWGDDKRENNLIAGISMGGYGAVKVALTYPEAYCACASLSGALDITRKGRPAFPDEWRAIFDPDQKDATELEGTRHDLFHLVRENRKNELPFPALYLWCGTDDKMLDYSRRFSSVLAEEGIPHVYEESAGGHGWAHWAGRIQPMLDFFAKV